MTSIDFRTRFQGDAVALDPSAFVREGLAAALDARGAEAGRAALRLGLVPLTFDVEGEPFTFDVADAARLVVRRSRGDGSLIVSLDRAAFSDLMQDVASTFGLQMTGRAAVTRGALADFIAWEPVLRCLLDGRPVYEPGAVTLRDRAGAPLDLQRSFTLADPREELGHFLAEAGYLHIRGMFAEEEMRAVSGELDAAIAQARRDDGASWWARTGSGEWYPSRILGFNLKSPSLRELLHGERFRALASCTGDELVQRDPDVGDSAEGLLKKIGVVEGISDVSWHKDCSMGDHSRRCCGLTVGISVTGAGRENGELGVVAGSHRASVALLGVEGVDLPRVPLPTRTGDVTVHCSCTLHMSRPPVSAERRVVYTGFNLAPRPADRIPPADLAELRRQRAALNDATRERQRDEAWMQRGADYEL
jgi:hypothetical protein